MDDHATFMDAAIAEAERARAEGNEVVGSVIVRDGQVIGRGRNLVRSDGDPTAHAEVVAIRDACRRLGVPELAGAACYTTMEPCPMCCWAIVASGIGRLVLGTRHADVDNRSVGGYAVERLIEMTGRRLELVTGVEAERCLALRAPR